MQETQTEQKIEDLPVMTPTPAPAPPQVTQSSQLDEETKLKIRIVAGINPETKNFDQFGAEFLANLDKEVCQQNTKREATFTRESIEYAFSILRQVTEEVVNESEVDRVLLQKEATDVLNKFQYRFNEWFDSESALGNLEGYFEVFTITKSSQVAIRSLAMAYMRYCKFMPAFTEQEAIRFLRTKKIKSNSRKTYASNLVTFFKAQGMPKDKLPFQNTKIKVADDDRPHRKTFPISKIADLIHHITASGDARACYYGALSTTYGFRPIELGRITGQNIDKVHHILTVQTAKHGRERIHNIPEEIRPHIYGYEAGPTDEKQMPRIWHWLCRDIGWRPQDRETGEASYKGYSWYAIRHALFTCLANRSEIQAQKIDKWGGWRTGVVSGAGMSNIYNAPSLTDMNDIDKEILHKHPFLGFWNGK